jgi:tetratricopeptide (TPR) repeat protein
MIDRSRLAAVADFAESCRTEGKLFLAKSIQDQICMSIQGGQYETEPLDYVHAQGNLAVTLHALGDLAEARQMQRRALDACRADLVPSHVTLTAENNFAATLTARGDFDDALTCQLEVSAARQFPSGATGSSILAAANNLAGTRYATGQIVEAKSLLLYALRHHEYRYTAPDVMVAKSNLATTYLAAGRPDEAARLQQPVVRGLRRLGEDRPDTLVATVNRGGIHYANGELAQAEELFSRLEERMTTRLGAEHPATLVAISNLSATLLALGLPAAALVVCEGLAGLLRRSLCDEHPDVLTAQANHAGIRYALGDTDEAITQTQMVVSQSRRALGDAHPVTVACRINLANMLQQSGDLRRAEGHYLAVRDLMDEKFGRQHPSALAARHGLAALFHLQHRTPEALATYREVTVGYRDTLGAMHPSTLATQLDYARTLWEWNDLRRAMELFEELVDKLDEQHPLRDAAVSDLALARARLRPHTGDDLRGETAIPVDLTGVVPGTPDSAGIYTSNMDYLGVVRDVGHQRPGTDTADDASPEPADAQDPYDGSVNDTALGVEADPQSSGVNESSGDNDSSGENGAAEDPQGEASAAGPRNGEDVPDDGGDLGGNAAGRDDEVKCGGGGATWGGDKQNGDEGRAGHEEDPHEDS